jgi:WD40 repeat protein
MSDRSFRGESSSAAHKPHATASQDEEGPLPSEYSSAAAAASSSLIHQASSNLKMPLDLIACLILPFIADRATWNSVCCASKELWLGGKKMTPPWPDKAFHLEHKVRHITFSPSGSQMAFALVALNAGQRVVHVWDVRGKQTLLTGHTGYIHCLEYSLDGECLASGGEDGSIRLWHAESFLANASRERSTPTPQQAVTILLCGGVVIALSFSRTDSNLLASVGHCSDIKVWNVKEQACIHSFDPGLGSIRSLCFAGGADSACIALAGVESVIRLWKAEGSSDFASEVIGEATNRRGDDLPLTAFSASGLFLTTCRYSFRENESTLDLHELKTMTKTQSVVIPSLRPKCFAVSPDNKQLVVGDARGRIRLVQIDDFTTQKALNTRGGSSSNPVLSLTFDPTCRVLACGCDDGTVQLHTL